MWNFRPRTGYRSSLTGDRRTVCQCCTEQNPSELMPCSSVHSLFIYLLKIFHYLNTVSSQLFHILLLTNEQDNNTILNKLFHNTCREPFDAVTRHPPFLRDFQRFLSSAYFLFPDIDTTFYTICFLTKKTPSDLLHGVLISYCFIFIYNQIRIYP